MNPTLTLLATLLAGLCVHTGAAAQASAPVAKPAVQAPQARPKPAPRVMSPEEKRDTASHDIQADRAAEPQVSIPLKGSKPGSAAEAKATRGGIDDAAARCNAEATEAARAACRDKAAAKKSR